MSRPPMSDPFHPELYPGWCDACGHEPHPDGDCPHHYPMDKCPGYRTVPISRELVNEGFTRLAAIQRQEKIAKEFYAKDFRK